MQQLGALRIETEHGNTVWASHNVLRHTVQPPLAVWALVYVLGSHNSSDHYTLSGVGRVEGHFGQCPARTAWGASRQATEALWHGLASSSTQGPAAGQPRSVRGALVNIVSFKFRVFLQDFLNGVPIAHKLESEIHRDTSASDGRSALTDFRVYRYAVELHGTSIGRIPTTLKAIEVCSDSPRYVRIAEAWPENPMPTTRLGIRACLCLDRLQDLAYRAVPVQRD